MWLKFMVDVGKYSNPMEHLVIRFESPKASNLRVELARLIEVIGEEAQDVFLLNCFFCVKVK